MMLVRYFLITWATTILGADATTPNETETRNFKVGPSQVLLPWHPPSVVSEGFAPTRAAIELQQTEGSVVPEGACVFWAAQHRDAIQLVHPSCDSDDTNRECRVLDSDGVDFVECFDKVLVQAIFQTAPRLLRSWVFASPVSHVVVAAVNGSIPSSAVPYRVDVVVAPIAKIAFATRSRRLAAGQLGDVGILAYDSEGNVFSSLQGLPFLWEVDTSSSILGVETLDMDAVASTSQRLHVEKISKGRVAERREFWASDVLIVRGIQTGRISIKTRLAGPEYAHVEPARVEFVVHEVVALHPALRILPPASVLQYHVLQSVGDVGLKSVTLPSPHFTWTISEHKVYNEAFEYVRSEKDNFALVTVTPSGHLEAGGTIGDKVFIGKAQVTCEDIRVTERHEAEVYITIPTSLSIFKESVGNLFSQERWQVAASMLSKTAGISGIPSTTASKMLMLQTLVNLEFDSSDPKSNSSPLVLEKVSRRRVNEDQPSVYLIKGVEYLFRVEAEGILPIDHGKVGGNGHKKVVSMNLPDNAAISWNCMSHGESNKVNDSPLHCPLTKIDSKLMLAWFRADWLGLGQLNASLIQVGSGHKYPVWKPSTPVSGSIVFRVVDKLSLRLFPAPIIDDGLKNPGLLASPIILPPNHTFLLEPFGGSGEYGFEPSNRSICTVRDAPERMDIPLSSTRFRPSVTQSKNLHCPVFELRSGEKVGVSIVTLYDRNLPSNAIRFVVIVANVDRVELRTNRLLLPVEEQGSQPEEANVAIVAFAKLPTDLRLPSGCSKWLEETKAWANLNSSPAHPITSIEDAQAYVDRESNLLAHKMTGHGGNKDNLNMPDIVSDGGAVHPFHRHPLQFASCASISRVIGGSGTPDGILAKAGIEMFVHTQESINITNAHNVPYTCGVLRVVGVRPGKAAIRVSSQDTDQEPVWPHVAAFLTFDAYRPLRAWAIMNQPVYPLPRPTRVNGKHEALRMIGGRSPAVETGDDGLSGKEWDFDLTTPLALKGLEEELQYGIPVGTTVSSAASRNGGHSNSGKHNDGLNIFNLALGSSVIVYVKDGPPERSSAYFQTISLTVTADGDDALGDEAKHSESKLGRSRVSITDAGKKGYHRITCIQAGEIVASIRIISQNTPRTAELVPTESVTRVSVLCAIPQYAEIVPLSAYLSTTSPETLRRPMHPYNLPSFTVGKLETVSRVDLVSSIGCGADYQWFTVLYDRELRPIHNNNSFSLKWNMTALGIDYGDEEVSSDGPFISSANYIEKSGRSIRTTFPSNSCCGTYRLKASVALPKLSTNGSLTREDADRLKTNLEVLKKRISADDLPLWMGTVLADSLVLVVTPPIRMLPVLREQGIKYSNIGDLRLFYQPWVAYRVMFRFGSYFGQNLEIMSDSGSKNGSSESGIWLYSEELQTMGMAIGNSEALAPLSPRDAMRRLKLQENTRNLPQERRAEFWGIKMAVDLTLMDKLSMGFNDNRAYLQATQPLEFSSNVSPSCLQMTREVWLAATFKTHALVQDTSLVLFDRGLFAPLEHQGKTKERQDDWRFWHYFSVKLSFVTAKSLRITVINDAYLLKDAGQLTRRSILNGGNVDGDVCAHNRRIGISDTKGQIERNRVYGIIIDAIGDDDLPIHPTFYPAMQLKLSLKNKSFNLTLDESSVQIWRRRVDGESQVLTALDDVESQSRRARPSRARSIGSYASFSSPYRSSTAELFEFVSHKQNMGISEVSNQLWSSTCADFFIISPSVPERSFTIQASAINLDRTGNQATVTASMEIEVYMPMRVQPSSLVMLPGGHSIELTLQGGPSGLRASTAVPRPFKHPEESRKGEITVSFSTGNSNIAKISSTQSSLLVTGDEGSTLVQATLFDSEGKGRAHATLPVKVALPDHIKLSSHASQTANGYLDNTDSLANHHRPKFDKSEIMNSEAKGDRAKINYASHIGKEQRSENGQISVFEGNIYPLSAILYDSEGEEFNIPHLMGPVGSLEMETFYIRQDFDFQTFGSLVAIPGPSAAACRYNWEVDGSSVLLVSSMDMISFEDDHKFSMGPYNERAFVVTSERLMNRGKKRVSGLYEARVSIFGAACGRSKVRITVTCEQNQRQVVRPLTAEVSVIVRRLPFETSNSAVPRKNRRTRNRYELLGRLPILLGSDCEYRLPGASVEVLSKFPDQQQVVVENDSGMSAVDAKNNEQCVSEGSVLDDSTANTASNAAKASTTSVLPPPRGSIALQGPSRAILRITKDDPIAAEHISGVSGISASGDEQSDIIVSVEIVEVASVSIFPRTHRLTVGASEYVDVVLRDKDGRVLVTPNSLSLIVVSSHGSVVDASIYHASPFETPQLKFSGRKLGCSSVSVFIQLPERWQITNTDYMSFPFDSLRICVDDEVFPATLPPFVPVGSSISILHGVKRAFMHLPNVLNIQLSFHLTALLSGLQQEFPSFGSVIPGVGFMSQECLDLSNAKAMLSYYSNTLSSSMKMMIWSALAGRDEPSVDQLEGYSGTLNPTIFVDEPVVTFRKSGESLSGISSLEPEIEICRDGLTAMGLHNEVGKANSGSLAVNFVISIADAPRVALALFLRSQRTSQTFSAYRSTEATTFENLPMEFRTDGLKLIASSIWQGLARMWQEQIIRGQSRTYASPSGTASFAWKPPSVASFIRWSDGLILNNIFSTHGNDCSWSGKIRSSNPNVLMLSGGCRGDFTASAINEGTALLGMDGSVLSQIQVKDINEESYRKGQTRVLAAAVCLNDEGKQDLVSDATWAGIHQLKPHDCPSTIKSSGTVPINTNNVLRILTFRVQSQKDGETNRNEGNMPWVDVSSGIMYTTSVGIVCDIPDPILADIVQVKSGQIPTFVTEGIPKFPTPGVRISENPIRLVHACIISESKQLTVQEDLNRVKNIKFSREVADECKWKNNVIPIRVQLMNISNVLSDKSNRNDSSFSVSKAMLGCIQWPYKLHTRMLYDKKLMPSFGVIRIPRKSELSFKLQTSGRTWRGSGGDIRGFNSNVTWPIKVYVFPASVEVGVSVSVSVREYETAWHIDESLLTVEIYPALPTNTVDIDGSGVRDLEWEAPTKCNITIRTNVQGDNHVLTLISETQALNETNNNNNNVDDWKMQVLDISEEGWSQRLISFLAIIIGLFVFAVLTRFLILRLSTGKLTHISQPSKCVDNINTTPKLNKNNASDFDNVRKGYVIHEQTINSNVATPPIKQRLGDMPKSYIRADQSWQFTQSNNNSYTNNTYKYGDSYKCFQ